MRVSNAMGTLPLRARWRLVGVLLWCLISVHLTQSEGRQNATGRIEVDVRDSLTGQAIPGAEVNLVWIQVPGPNIVSAEIADGVGHVVFAGLAQGDYEIRVRHDAYVTTGLVERVGLDQTGLEFSVELRLPGGATLAGRVVDPDGEPVRGVLVEASRIAFREGRAVLAGGGRGGRATTGDEGEFALTGLSAGEYYLRVETEAPALLADGYPRSIWYPAVLRFSEAAPFIVRGGDQLTGLEVRLRRAETYSVSGTILNLTPGGVQAPDGSLRRWIASMYIGPADPASPETPYSAGTQPDGEQPDDLNVDEVPFRISGIAPGSYYFHPMFRTSENLFGTTRRTRVDIIDRNLEGLEIVLLPNPDLTGTVELEGGEDGIDWSIVRVLLRAEDNLPASIALWPRRAAVDPEGRTFRFPETEAGRFSVIVSGLPADAYVSSVQLGARTLPDAIVDVTYGTMEPLRLTISRNGSSVGGHVRDGRGEPVGGAGVVLVPDAPRRENGNLYRRVVADEQGGYAFSGVAPGGYRIFAWRALPDGRAEESPRFLGRYEILGQPVSVNTPSHAVDVRLVE